MGDRYCVSCGDDLGREYDPPIRCDSCCTAANMQPQIDALTRERDAALARVAALVQTVSEAHGIPWESDVDVAIHIGNAVANAKAYLAGVTRERDAALARVAKLEAVLAKPDDDEAGRLSGVASRAATSVLLRGAHEPGEPARAGMRALLADLRQRAGVTS